MNLVFHISEDGSEIFRTLKLDETRYQSQLARSIAQLVERRSRNPKMRVQLI